MRGLVAAASLNRLFDPETLRDGTYGPRAGYTKPVDGATWVDFTTADSWTTITNAVNAAAAGTHFWFAAGDYRADVEAFITLPRKTGQQFHGEAGAVINGSKDISPGVATWTFDAGAGVSGCWYVDGQTQRIAASDPDDLTNCVVGYRCEAAETVWFNDDELKHRAVLADVAAGEMFFDYTADRIYIGDDPAGQKVEAAVARGFLTGSSTDEDAFTDVVIKNLTLEKFGTAAQYGVVYALLSQRWLVENCEIRRNYSTGARVGGSDGTIRGCRLAYNGHAAYGGGVKTSQEQLDNGRPWSHRLRIENNEMAHNMHGSMRAGHEGGGGKLGGASMHCVIRRNWCHDNGPGRGLWSDGSIQYTTYEENLVEDCGGDGIMVEVSYEHQIQRNVVRRCGHIVGTWGYGAGIGIFHSRNAIITDNIIDDCWNGITLVQQTRVGAKVDGEWEARGARIRRNVVYQNLNATDVNGNGVWITGAVSDDGTGNIWGATWDNRWDSNWYQVPSGYARWVWDNDPGPNRTWTVWLTEGHGNYTHDRGSTRVEV